jgi:hypothetical protein
MPEETVEGIEQMPGDLLRRDEAVVQRIARLEHVAQKGQRMNIPQADDMLWLIRELRAALEDTERLDWLDDQVKCGEEWEAVNFWPKQGFAFTAAANGAKNSFRTVREALDAARKKGEPNVG